MVVKGKEMVETYPKIQVVAWTNLEQTCSLHETSPSSTFRNQITHLVALDEIRESD